MTGGGFGGSSIALVQVDGVDEARRGILDAFAERGWTEPRSFVVTAGDAARRDSDRLGFWLVAQNVGVHRREPAGTLDGRVGSHRCERQPPSPVPVAALGFTIGQERGTHFGRLSPPRGGRAVRGRAPSARTRS